MGFFSGLGKLVKGAVGLATGGVGNAVLGVAGDLLAGGGGGQKQSGSSSTGASGTSTQQTMLRDWSPEERAVYEQAMAGMAASGQPMTPAAEAEIRKRIYDANFLPAQQAIQQNLATGAAQNYSLAARRGGGQTSAVQGQGATDVATAGRLTGEASQNATIAAENQLLAEKQMQMQNTQNYLSQINAMWDARLKGSKVVTSNSSSGYSTSESSIPGGGIGGAIGYALGNKDSWLNKNVLGKSTGGLTKNPKWDTKTPIGTSMAFAGWR